MNHVVYYRDSDGVVVGSSSVDGQIDVSAELVGWGPGVSFLEVRDPSIRTGFIRKVVGGQLIHEPDPVHQARAQKQRQAWDKIKLRLTLDDEEMKIMFGPRQ